MKTYNRSVYLSSDVHTRLKIYCAVNGLLMAKFITNAITAALNKAEKKGK